MLQILWGFFSATNFDSPQNESTPIIRANTNRLLGSTSNSGLFSLENANFHDVDLHGKG
jgi:hypothetical protein